MGIDTDSMFLMSYRHTTNQFNIQYMYVITNVCTCTHKVKTRSYFKCVKPVGLTTPANAMSQMPRFSDIPDSSVYA